MLSRFRPPALPRLAILAAVGVLLSGCLSLDGLTGSGAPHAFRSTALVRSPALLVATTRKPAANPDQAPWFGSERGRGLAFAEARLAPPDRSLTGRIASVVSGGWQVASVGPAQEEGAAEAFAAAAAGRDVLVYVHGYKESFETAAVSAAQLSSGIGFAGATGLFTWPSAASTLDYGYDRESALWSRDALEDLLARLAAAPGGGRIHLVGHSMGTLLTLETLRMLRASGGEGAMARIGSVVLAAPDIDLDLFTRSIERLGPDARKITVITSTKDRALAISSRIAGGVRAGAADRSRLERLEELGVRIADASEYGGGVVNHDLFLSNREVQQVVKRAVERAG